jgi:hypothetical protein
VNKALKLVFKIDKLLAQERSCQFKKKSSISGDYLMNKTVNSSEFISSNARMYIRFSIINVDNDTVSALLATR